jgi:hypothetical protein
MSEPLAEPLSRFTPDGTALDRDALLFAAGRASVRPRRWWMAVAGTLAVTQLLTLALLWPGRVPPSAGPARSPASVASVEWPASRPALDPGALGTLRQRWLLAKGELPAPAAAEPPAAPDPAPLRAFGALNSVPLD